MYTWLVTMIVDKSFCVGIGEQPKEAKEADSDHITEEAKKLTQTILQFSLSGYPGIADKKLMLL